MDAAKGYQDEFLPVAIDAALGEIDLLRGAREMLRRTVSAALIDQNRGRVGSASRTATIPRDSPEIESREMMANCGTVVRNFTSALPRGARLSDRGCDRGGR
jgi:hypothetical protein